MTEVAELATALADFIYKEEEQQEPATDVSPVITDSVHVVAKEMDRLEVEDVKNQNAENKAKGFFCRYYKSGVCVRFLNTCRDIRTGKKRIETVAELLEEGRTEFSRRHNMGYVTMKYLDKALENLYNITVW